MTFKIRPPVFSRRKKREEGKEPELPPLRVQAQNAVKAAGKVIKALGKGQPIFLSPAKSEENRAICRSNQCGFFLDKRNRCSHPKCGCFTALKTRLSTEDCPVGLFGPNSGQTPD